MSSDTLTNEQLDDIMSEDLIIQDNLDEYKVNVPNYVTDNTADNILKTEIVLCEKCMHPNIIGTIPFNRREKEVKHIKLDTVTYAAFSNFAKLNKLDMNSAMALFMRIVNNPDVSKMMMGTFTGISKRRGRNYRSKAVTTS